MNDSDTIAFQVSKIESLVTQLKDVSETINDSAVCSKVTRSGMHGIRYRQVKQTFAYLTARLL